MTIPPSPLSRFAVERNKLRDDTAKPKMFEPNRQLKLSMFRTGGITQDDIQDIGLSVVRQHPSASRLYGWATLKRGEVEGAGLQITDEEEPPRHSNVVGWPEETDKRLELQISLAGMARPHRLNPPLAA